MTTLRPVEEIACLICYDSLFYGRNDLDEIMGTAATTCGESPPCLELCHVWLILTLLSGHVFHETCIRRWVATRIEQQVQAHGGDGFHPPPRLKHIECPTCRSICWTGKKKPEIQKLYLDLAGEEEAARSSPSSSSRAGQGSQARRRGDQKVMALAKRARDWQEVVSGLGVESLKDDVDGAIARVETLQLDLASDKALQGVRVSWLIRYKAAAHTVPSRLTSEVSTRPSTCFAQLWSQIPLHRP